MYVCMYVCVGGWAQSQVWELAQAEIETVCLCILLDNTLPPSLTHTYIHTYIPICANRASDPS